MEVRFNGRPGLLIQATQPFRNAAQSNLAAKRSQELDAFVRSRPAFTAASAERAMAARPAVFDYHAAKFLPSDAQAFMATRLL